MRPLTRICAVALAAGLVGAAPALAVLNLEFQPSSQTKLLGEPASVDIVLSGLSAAGEIVSAFDLDVTYDPAILNAAAVTLTSVPQMGGLSATLFGVTFGTGVIDLFVTSLLSDDELDGLQNDDTLTLARLSFSTLEVGTSLLAFDLTGANMIVGRRAEPLDITAGNGSITVRSGGAVPEPGTALLLLSGMIVLAGWRIRHL